MGRLSTPIWPAKIANCSIAAGRLVSSEAIRTRLLFRSFNRLASLAVVVVLPEPCKPTIKMVDGGLSIFSASAGPSPPRTAINSSCTILTTCWPGVTDLVTAWPVARVLTALMKSRATDSDTSASSKAVRTSRRAASTSASDSAPALVRRSKTPPRRSERLSNMALSSINAQTGGVRGLDQNGNSTRGRNALTDGDPGLSLGTGSDQPPGN